MSSLLYFVIFCGMIALGVNSIFGLIAYSMAKLRNLRPFPVFLAALVGSVAVVFFVGMFPKIEKKEEFPKEV
jgi:ribose/xylose/arabinose/galactoside ABC-type transport system permease subunit